MTITASALARFYRCGELYRLASEGVPLPPTTRQCVSRAVRRAIQADLQSKMDTGALLATPDARRGLESAVRAHLAGDVYLTDAEAAAGNRRIFETVMLSAQRVYLMHRAVVAPKIQPAALSRPFELVIGEHSVTGIIEIEEPTGTRATKVRARRPEEGEASRDLSLAIQALALEQMDGTPPSEATVDYLIEAKELAYVRQTVEFEGGMLAAAESRVKAALQAIEQGAFVPVDSQAWYCRSCQLRPVCRYV